MFMYYRHFLGRIQEGNRKCNNNRIQWFVSVFLETERWPLILELPTSNGPTFQPCHVGKIARKLHTTGFGVFSCFSFCPSQTARAARLRRAYTTIFMYYRPLSEKSSRATGNASSVEFGDFSVSFVIPTFLESCPPRSWISAECL